MEDNMNKRPSLQFYPGDWWRANDIKGCSMSTQGVWFNLLMAMWDSPEQGKISGSKDALCRIVGANEKEFDLFISENKLRNFANVTFRNKKVTIKNRRMYKEYINRTDTKMRVRKHRQQAREEGNREVTPPSSSSTSSSTSYNNKSVTLINPTLQDCIDSGFLVGVSEQQAKEFYEHYRPQGWMWGNGQQMCPPLQDCMVRWRNNQYKFNKQASHKETAQEQGARLRREGNEQT